MFIKTGSLVNVLHPECYAGKIARVIGVAVDMKDGGAMIFARVFSADCREFVTTVFEPHQVTRRSQKKGELSDFLLAELEWQEAQSDKVAA